MIFKDKKKINLLIIVALVIIVPFISIGYSALSTVLNIRSDVTSHHVVLRTKDFPDEIEYLMDNDSCMARYEGEVTDEVNNTVSAKNVYFNKCSDKRNIIFNNMCWQMIRTTETGGIKMIYNGEPVDGKCESTRGTHKGIVQSNDGISQSINSSYLYGSSFTYNKSTNEFKLIDTVTSTWSDSTYQNLLGKFTCKSSNDTCTTIYQINSYASNSNAYLSYYTISDTNYAQIGTSSFNAMDRNPAMVGYMFNKIYNYKYKSISGTIEYKFGNGFTYDASTNTYNLAGTTQNISDWSSGYNTINNTHYTCWNDNGTCNIINYVYYTSNSYAYYFSISDGKSVSDILEEMLSSNDVNRYNSSIKGIIDVWYKQNMLSKTSMLEDTVYCNARNITSYGSFNPNGGGTGTGYGYNLSFKANDLTTNIICPNVTDQFAVSNNKAKLVYPIALATHEELYNIVKRYNSPNDEDIINTGYNWYGLSPSYFAGTFTYVRLVGASGYLYYGNPGVDTFEGVRPVISLKSGVEIASGTGSETDPWVIDESEKLHDKIVNLSSTDSLITKYEGQVTDRVGVTETASKVYFDKNPNTRNVIFAGLCWQVIRTTETGGTKVIYNGIPENGKCGSTRGNHKGIVGATGTTENLNASYLYGSSFTYDTVNNNFTLVNTTTATWSASTYQNLLGKFTCKNTTGTCTTLYNVNGYNDATTAHTSAYTIGNTNYAQIGTSAFNAYGKSAAMVGYMFNKVYDLKSINPGTNTYKYGNSFTYSNGTYTLSGTTQDISDWSTGYNKLKNTHYTCWNTSGTCNTISYIFITSSTYANYIEISGGKSVSDALNEMLYNNDVNTYNSSIKGIIDNWYVNNLSTRTNMLEDTVYCNARNTISLGAWNPNGGSTISSYMIKFKNYNVNNDISCPNETDQFAVSNNKAKLTYPVALATQEELYTLTNNSNSTYYDVLTKTGDSWRNFSPYHYGGGTQMRRVSESGGVNAGNSGTIDAGVRPVISLKNSIEINSGSGSEADPWVIAE